MDIETHPTPPPTANTSATGADLPTRSETMCPVNRIRRIKHWFRSVPGGRIVDIGWSLRQPNASLIWSAPRPALTKAPRAAHAKSLTYCPAMLDHESRLIEVACPIDAHIRFQRDAQGRPGLNNALGDGSPIRAKQLGDMVKLVSEREWRHPQRPIIQIVTPYLFIADEPVWLSQLPPIHFYNPTPAPGILIGGRFPIDVWPRSMMWAFEWHDVTKDLILKRGDPWFVVRFEPMDPSRKTRLVKARLTPELDLYLRGLEGVTNYVRGTFGLFEVARGRRPKKLLTPE